SSRRRHTRFSRDWSSDVCSSDLDSALLILDRGNRQRDFDACAVLALASRLVMFDALAEANARQNAWLLIRTVGRNEHGDGLADRSEERRVGKECRSGWSAARWKE